MINIYVSIYICVCVCQYNVLVYVHMLRIEVYRLQGMDLNCRTYGIVYLAWSLQGRVIASPQVGWHRLGVAVTLSSPNVVAAAVLFWFTLVICNVIWWFQTCFMLINLSLACGGDFPICFICL